VLNHCHDGLVELRRRGVVAYVSGKYPIPSNRCVQRKRRRLPPAELQRMDVFDDEFRAALIGY
jgi:hypothetical protein